MRIALNPIQWMASADGWLDPSLAPEPEKLLALVKQAGFNAIMAEVPAGWSVNQYRDAVDALGTWIETEAESRAVLDALPDLAFLPDTGHLAWAGADVRALIGDYAERVSFVHVKASCH